MLLYLITIGVVGVGAIATMACLFFAGYPSFLADLFRGPGSAIQSDLFTVGLILTSLVLIGTLIGLVVYVGAKHLPEVENGQDTIAEPAEEADAKSTRRDQSDR